MALEDAETSTPSITNSTPTSEAGNATATAAGCSRSRDVELLDQVRREIRRRRYGSRVALAYLGWVERFLAATAKAASGLSADDFGAFLASLSAQPPKVRNQARSALLLLAHGVLGLQTDGAVMNRVPTRPAQAAADIPLTRVEVVALLSHARPQWRLLLAMVYGGGLRVFEAATLRIRDLEPDALRLVLRSKPPRTDRWALLPRVLIEPLRQHLDSLRAQHQHDVSLGAGLGSKSKIAPASRSRRWEWQYVFPAEIVWAAAEGTGRRRHFEEAEVHAALVQAARAAGITRPLTALALRQSFKVHLQEAGHEPVFVHELLGIPRGLDTTVAAEGAAGANRGLTSPLDELPTSWLPSS